MKLIVKKTNGQILDWLEDSTVNGLNSELCLLDIPNYVGDKTETTVGDLDPSYVLEYKNNLLNDLHAACTAYQVNRLDANGTSAMIGKVTMATLAGTSHSKATANINWWQNIWVNDYEIRRQAILDGEFPSMDFSNHGELPYRVAEAMAEE
ncbi:MAG TPA: hypothetical protein PLA71_00445 [Saccharofermentans sp.]|nr:hypothetical protein [Saccharofermentans sp.]